MSHIVLPALGTAGDVHPVVGVGRALRQRGHRVTVYTDPSQHAYVREAGLEAAWTGPADLHDRVLAHPDVWHPSRSWTHLAREALGPITGPLFAYLQEVRPDLVAASGLCPAARLADEILGIPCVTMVLQPMLVRSAVRPGATGVMPFPGWLPEWAMQGLYAVADRVLLDPPLREPIAAICRAHGRPVPQGFLGAWLASPRGVVGLWPDWFAPRPPDWPAHLVTTGFVEADPGALDDPALAAFLDAGAPPVVVTFGSGMRHAHDVIARSVASLDAVGLRTLVLTRTPQQVPSPLPSSALHVPWAPLGPLLQRCAAIVHHGGIGTCARALEAGIPQVIVPHAHDQFDNAAHLARLGVATRVDTGATSKVGAAVRGLLDGDAVRQARDFGQRCDAGGAERAAEVMEGVIARGDGKVCA